MKTNSSNLSDAHSSNEKTLVSSIVVDAISLRSASEWLSKYTNTNNKIVKTEHFNHLQSLYEVLQGKCTNIEQSNTTGNMSDVISS